MKIKTQDLTGPALDWVVLKCELALHGGWPDDAIMLGEETDYSSSWAAGGPIIERERIQLRDHNDLQFYWTASLRVVNNNWVSSTVFEDGPTPLIAAMRCYCFAKLGDEIDIPEELCLQQSS